MTIRVREIIRKILYDYNKECATFTNYFETSQENAGWGCIVASGTIIDELSKEEWRLIESRIHYQLTKKRDGALIMMNLSGFGRLFMVIYQYQF